MWILALCAATAAAQAPAANNPPAYTLEAGDDIEIRFHYNPEFNERAVIRPDGIIAMPLIGELQVAGLAPSQLSKLLEEKYAAEAKQPKVLVQVRNYANRRIFVGGEVMRPGPFVLAGKQTIMGALMEAGGLLRTADRGKVTLIRRTASGPEMRTIALKAAKSAAPEAASIALEPFDLIVVNRSGIAKANQVVDQYIRSMSPALLNAGFNYLYNNAGAGLFPGLQ
ncbi:MAG TPA: polysaccharide biosynthesis/export family protein [Bryobacteraceae bacterium]|nr:polysaccharide biosynthesis/export family protein [Bryobacteraceae bacterium]